MNRIFFLTFLLRIAAINAVGQDLGAIRKAFHQAVLDPNQSRSFHEFLQETKPSSSTVKAYKAVSEAMLAREVWNPFTKLSQVMKYNELMEVAVSEDKENIEIRFLRIAIEHNLPRFLGLSKHLAEDRAVIVKNMNVVGSMGLDPSFKHYILYFLNDTGLCTPEEIASMEASLVSSE